MKKSFSVLFWSVFFILLVGIIALFVAAEQMDTVRSRESIIDDQTSSSSTIKKSDESSLALAFFYQTVGLFRDGVGENTVQVGYTVDGEGIKKYDVTALDWEQGFSIVDSYGDPVFSRLSDGTWTLTSWTTHEDPRGSGAMMYWEGMCPVVDQDEVVVINASDASGCQQVRALQVGKTSQVFEVEDNQYVFHASNEGIYLAHLGEEGHSGAELQEMCVLPSSVQKLEDLGWGESMPVLASNDLHLSDTAIAQREDGTWVLFVKGIEKDGGCEQGTLCELCSRAIYRTTSTDLVHWSDLERVVGEASVPEATQTVDGTVWLYYQDFSEACEAEDQQLAARAPISGVYEVGSSYSLSQPVRVEIAGELFETDSKLHYATNGNPVVLPDKEAQAILEACLK